MPPRRRIATHDGITALTAWWTASSRGEAPQARDLATAVRFTLEELAARAPGGAVEVRIPPYAAAQCIEGPRHTRGTPPNVVETDPATWLELACGRLSWAEALAAGRIRASGARGDLAAYLPVPVAVAATQPAVGAVSPDAVSPDAAGLKRPKLAQ